MSYGRKKLLLKQWEQRTDTALKEAVDRCNLRALLKVRVASGRLVHDGRLVPAA
jgi:hypothetical protein